MQTIKIRSKKYSLKKRSAPEKKKRIKDKEFFDRYIRFKIITGERGDRFEEEAEKVSKKILENQEDISVSEKKESVDFYGGNGKEVSSYTEKRIRNSLSYGKPLESKVKAEFEYKFKADFTNVRIHTGSYASELNKELGSEAFTFREHIFFGKGKYNPETTAGKKLIAHELTHVLQQTGGQKGLNLYKSEEKIQGLWGWIKKGWEKVKNLGKKVVEIASDLKDLVFEKISEYAGHIPGFYLLVYILGRNPITGKPVKRNFTNLITGILSLIPGSVLLIEKIKDSGVVDKVGEWIDKKLKELNLSWDYVKSVFRSAINSLTLADLKDPFGAIRRIVQIISPLINRIKLFISSILEKIPEIIFVSVLKVLKAPVNIVMQIINKGKATLSLILKDPVGFLKNLLFAVKTGFLNFKNNIFKHLKRALFDWLFGQLAKAGIQLPEKFNLKSIFFMVLQVLGITYENIKEKLIKKLGKEKVEKLEKGFTLLKDFAKGKVESIAEFLFEKFEQTVDKIKSSIIGKIRNWVVFKVVRSAVERLIAMWNPIGVIFEAVKTIYNVVIFFYENIKRIKDLAFSVFNSITEIATGKIKKAANYIEMTLSRTLPLIINFLARFLKLGDLPKKIKHIIKEVRKPVDKLLDRIIDFVIEKGVKFLTGVVKKGKEKVESVVEWWKRKVSIKSGNKRYSVFFDTQGDRAFLVVSSSPKKRYLNFVNSIKEKYNLKDTDYPINEMLKIGKKLDGRKKNLNKRANEFVKDLERFAGLIKELPPLEEFPLSVVEYGGVKPSGSAKWMKALILTKNNVEGSGPSDNPPVWKNLRPIRRLPPEYIRGHLLNEKLGGPGKRWNLAPITKQANKDHEKNIESVIKKMVLEEGKTVEYHVIVKYKTRKKRKVESEAGNKPKLKKALETERKELPDRFVIYGWEKKYDPRSKKWKNIKTIDKVHKKVIFNKIPQELNEEVYDNIIRKHFDLGKIIEVNKVNIFALKKITDQKLGKKIIEERDRAPFKDFKDFEKRMKKRIKEDEAGDKGLLSYKLSQFLKKYKKHLSFKIQ
ncbi:eCIS core domain-containing protein [Persephonella sp.]